MSAAPRSPDINPETMTSEQRSLAEFTSRLASTTSEPALLDSGVRKEATLLMSLLASGSADDRPSTISSSDSSAVSDDSHASHSYMPREFFPSEESFFFSCPSLSLDPSSTATGHQLITQMQEKPEIKDLAPARLLQRPLRIDTLDALPLSADALSRNLMLSFQKASEWRLQAWRLALSDTITRREHELREQGATEQEIKDELLQTPEALLLVQLTSVKITVTDTVTEFRLSKNVPQQDGSKRRKTSHENALATTQPLVMDCQVYFETPAGNVQVTLEVPGGIQGIFPTNTFEKSPEQLVHVSVHLDTDMLAAMMEKSTRNVVRASLEHVMQDQDSTTETLLSPAPTTTAPVVSASDMRSAMADGLSAVPNDLTPTSTPLPFLPRQKDVEPSLVSPPLHDNPDDYREVTEGSPALPFLVEAACRAKRH